MIIRQERCAHEILDVRVDVLTTQPDDAAVRNLDSS